MKFMVYTKPDLGVLYMKFLSDWNISLIHYNFTFTYYLRISTPSLGVPQLLYLVLTLSIYVIFHIGLIFSICSCYLLSANIGIYQKSYNFI